MQIIKGTVNFYNTSLKFAFYILYKLGLLKNDKYNNKF